MQTPNLKQCKECGVSKPHSEYHVHKGRSDGLRAKCKECRRAENLANKEMMRPYYADYHKKNAKRICARVNSWRATLFGEKLQRYKAAVSDGGKRFRTTEKGRFNTTRHNLSKLTGIPPEMIDIRVVEAKVSQLRVRRYIRELIAVSGKGDPA